MRKSAWFLSIGLILALASPIPVRAQFQQPTDEELKMTSDPKAPGALAVYLNIVEDANDPLHYRSYYARIKVLTEQGKELAKVELPILKNTDKVANLKGRTIQPDGTIIPLTVKPADLSVEKAGDGLTERKFFTLPSAEVGSILEYTYQVIYSDVPASTLHGDYVAPAGNMALDLRRPDAAKVFDASSFAAPAWDIQRRYFVHKAHYQFTPFKKFLRQQTTLVSNSTPDDTDVDIRLLDERGREERGLFWWEHLPAGISVQTTAIVGYSVDVTDVPAAPEEEWMPPLESQLYKVGFFYGYERDGIELWKEEVKDWSKSVDKLAEPTAAITGAVKGLIADGDSPLDQAKKLYIAVQALDNTDYSRKKDEAKKLSPKTAKTAEETWTQKSGSSQDMAVLYLAMLRAAGLTAYPMKVVDRNRGVFNSSYMNLGQLDSTLVYLSAGDKQVLLDPGEKMCPFGLMSWRHSDAGGVAEGAQGASVGGTPAQNYKDNVTTRMGDLTVDSQGGVTGQIRITMTGQEALRWRQRALQIDDADAKKEFDRELEGIVPQGVEAHVEHFIGIDDPYSNLMAVVSVKGSLGTAAANRLTLPALFFQARQQQPFVNAETRHTVVDVHYGDVVSDQVTFRLPAGMTAEGAPKDANISWAGHAVFSVKTVSSPGQIVISDTMARGFSRLKVEEYQDLRGFYQKVAAAGKDQFALIAGQPASGN